MVNIALLQSKNSTDQRLLVEGITLVSAATIASIPYVVSWVSAPFSISELLLSITLNSCVSSFLDKFAPTDSPWLKVASLVTAIAFSTFLSPVIAPSFGFTISPAVTLCILGYQTAVKIVILSYHHLMTSFSPILQTITDIEELPDQQIHKYFEKMNNKTLNWDSFSLKMQIAFNQKLDQLGLPMLQFNLFSEGEDKLSPEEIQFLLEKTKSYSSEVVQKKRNDFLFNHGIPPEQTTYSTATLPSLDNSLSSTAIQTLPREKVCWYYLTYKQDLFRDVSLEKQALWNDLFKKYDLNPIAFCIRNIAEIHALENHAAISSIHAYYCRETTLWKNLPIEQRNILAIKFKQFELSLPCNPNLGLRVKPNWKTIDVVKRVALGLFTIWTSYKIFQSLSPTRQLSGLDFPEAPQNVDPMQSFFQLHDVEKLPAYSTCPSDGNTLFDQKEALVPQYIPFMDPYLLSNKSDICELEERLTPLSQREMTVFSEGRRKPTIGSIAFSKVVAFASACFCMISGVYWKKQQLLANNLTLKKFTIKATKIAKFTDAILKTSNLSAKTTFEPKEKFLDLDSQPHPSTAVTWAIFGSINQYDQLDGAQSRHSCSCCALSFLDSFFKQPNRFVGKLHEIQQNIDEAIKEGKQYFEKILIVKKEEQNKLLNSLIGEDEIVAEQRGESIGTSDASFLYPCLKTIELKQAQQIQLLKDASQRLAFWRSYVTNMQRFAESHQTQLGSVITCNGLTSSFGVIKSSQGGYWYVLFDSHGDQKKDTSTKGFIRATKSKELAAQNLFELFSYKATNANSKEKLKEDIGLELTKEELQSICSEDRQENKVHFYHVVPTQLRSQPLDRQLMYFSFRNDEIAIQQLLKTRATELDKSQISSALLYAQKGSKIESDLKMMLTMNIGNIQ